jgi:transcriptional regulator with XRE-family HTH domain
VPPGRAKTRSDHELAQALDLASREEGLSTRDLAQALNCSDRTIRRYLSAERRPDRELVIRWEEVCHVEPGRLTALHDRAEHRPAGDDDDELDDAPQPTRARTRRRPWYAPAIAAGLFLAALGLFLVRHEWSSPPAGTAIVHKQARDSDIPHHFTPSYIGDVWIRVTPTRGEVGEDHHVRLRWGPIQNGFVVKRLGAEGRTFVLQKNDREDITFLVKVDPPAAVHFGEGAPPDGDTHRTPARWRSRTSG